MAAEARISARFKRDCNSEVIIVGLQDSGSMGMRAAAFFQFGSKYISMGASLIITAVLARLVTPLDFGLVAIVMVFAGLFALLSDMGVGVAIVQYRDLTEEDYGALFGFSILLAIVLTVLYCATAPLISYFYSDDRLTGLCLAASPMLFFSTLNMVPNGLMLKDKRFDLIAIRLVVATVVSGVIAIILASFEAGAVSIIVQSVLSAVIVLVWNLCSRPIRNVSLCFASPLKRIVSYTAYQFGFSLINYFSRNLDNILVGRFLGSVQLGYYDKAYKLTTYPINAFSSVIGSVIQPFMAEHQDDSDVIFDSWTRIEKLLSLVAAPVSAAFFCCSAEIVGIFYGPGWEQAIPVFAALSISIYFQMMGNTAGAFYQSLGRTDYLFKNGLINTCVTLVGLFIGLTSGSILGVACGVGIAYCLHMTTICYFLVYRCFGKPLSCLKVFLPEIFACLSAAAICCIVFHYVELPEFASLTGKTIIIFGVVILAYWRFGQLPYIKQFFRK